jgi:hypothetical protein
MTWPPNKIPGSITDCQCAATVPVHLTNVVILKMLSTSGMHLLEKGRLIDIFVQTIK